MPHLILLGDSVFDNGAYVPGGPPVIEQLRSRLPREWRATMLAQDGAIIDDVAGQLQQLPRDASHVVVSAGGNDVLQYAPIVYSPAPRSVELLSALTEAQLEFRNKYLRMLRMIHETQLPTIACTIYDAVPGLGQNERVGLSLFNDVLLRELFAAHVVVLDLRLLCNEVRDYSSISPIEPSEMGGDKIARALQQILVNHDFSQRQSLVYG